MPACKDPQTGRFTRCPGAAAPQRRHRRVRRKKTKDRTAAWEGCGCPPGTRRVTNRRKGGRGWSCIRATKKGPRFVKATCPTTNGNGEG